MTQRIDGKAMAASLRERIRTKADALAREHGITAGLAVVLVGEDPASQVYVRNKKKMTEAAGMHSYEYLLPERTTQAELLDLVARLNANNAVHGILVQLPLPRHIDENAVINAIDPAKDVDGFHVVNTGMLATQQEGAFISCTPLGCLLLIQHIAGEDLSGLHAVVIGRSNIVGKPMAQLLLNHNATVTICHSRSKDIAALSAQADIVVAAVGKPKLVQAHWIKEGAIVIDVGINRLEGGALVGDVDFDAVAPKAKAITPVPGGVGPMTIACLLRNTLQAACQSHGVPFEC